MWYVHLLWFCILVCSIVCLYLCSDFCFLCRNNLTASGIGASRLQGTLPPHIYHPSPGTPSHPHIDNSKWNRALSELQQSIKQVRQGLGQQQPEDVQSRSDGDTSEHSLFSRGDLSHHSSHSTLVHS